MYEISIDGITAVMSYIRLIVASTVAFSEVPSADVLDNEIVPGCTISKEVNSYGNVISYFSLAKNTDVSAEIYSYNKLLIVASGELIVYKKDGEERKLKAREAIITDINIPVGMKTETGCVYTEVQLRRNSIMNEAVKIGEVFKLADLIPYQEDKIINMDLIHNDKMKFVIMAFDKGTGLTKHSAPGEAIIFALDGEAIIGYEGEEHRIKAGENFSFAKGGEHYVTADSRFKMALLLTL